MNFDFPTIWASLPRLLEATGVTVLATILTMALAMVGGLAIMLLRVAPSKPLNIMALCYVEAFRNIPLILIVYWGYYILPIWFDLTLPALLCGILGLTLVVSAYNAETFRAGVNSIRKGQFDAALALGMSKSQMYRKIIIPQAIVRVLPILASTWVSLFKDTSLLSVIGVQELAFTALEIRTTTFRVLEILSVMALIYWCLGYPQAKLVDWLYRKFGKPE
jgi:polar amino acid transport system permease protein